MTLDAPTLILVSALTGLFLPVVLLGMSRTNESDPAVVTWMRAAVIYALGMVCLMLRNVAPDVISIGAGNALLLLGYLELYQGFRLFFGRPVQRRWQGPLVVVYLLLMLAFMQGPQSFDIRVVLASVFLAGAAIAIAVELWSASRRISEHGQEGKDDDRWVLVGFTASFVVNAVVLLARAAVFGMTVHRGQPIAANAWLYPLSFLLAIFIHVLLAAGLPTLLSRRSQRALLYSEASLRRVQDVGRVAYTWLDTRTGVVIGNAALRDMLGLPADLSLTAELMRSLVHPDDVPRMQRAMVLSQKGDYYSEDQEYRLLRYSDQREIWVAFSSQVQRDPTDGHPILLSILRDITSIKASELSALRDKDEAEQSSRSKSQFLANMSHEIRTPMNAILGMLNLLQASTLNSRQRDYASKAEGAAKSLLGLINDILDFSKVDAGKMVLEHQPFSLDAVLRNLAVVLSASTRSKNLEVLFDVDPRLPDGLIGDALRLQQVLINLGGNALKFTEAGHVVVALQCLHADTESVRIRFSVQDSGIGIAPEHQQHIFEAFSQAEASTTRRFGGTGLGLAICKHLVERMGGTLQVQSTLGVGTTFAFDITLPVSAQSSQHLVNAQTHRLNSRRALVVDDNRLAGQLLLRALQSLGWDTQWVDSGEAAVEHVRTVCANGDGEFPFALVLMDWQMPGMDGWQACAQLRELAAACTGVPPLLLMVSAHGRQDLALRTEQEQSLVDGFLVKPVTAPMLQDAIVAAKSDQPDMRRASAGRSSHRQLAGMRILVVEDNLLNQQVAEELLTNEGALVSLAANGQLGVEAVRAANPPFDVVLMDVQMPVMDGYTATQVIRQQLGLTDLPIIAMTANAMTGDREICLAAGMNEHVGKPFDMAVLVSQLIRITGFVAAPSATLAPQPGAVSQTTAPVHVPGMDLPGALARMSHARGLYIRTARDFMDGLPAWQTTLQAQLAGDNRQQAKASLHTLKGLAGTLGLNDLAQQAQRLESLCMQDISHATFQAALTDLQATVQSSIQLLSAALAALQKQEPAALKKVPLKPEQQAFALNSAINVVSQLLPLLQSSDMQALDTFSHHRMVLQSLPDGWCDRLEQDLQNLDFESAYKTCLACEIAMEEHRPDPSDMT